MIRVDGLSVCYGAQPALTDISLQIEPGECLLVTGPSGCGKSTLARTLNGLIPHAIVAKMAGRVLIDGHDTARTSVAELAASVGLVFQNPATQLFNLTVDDEVAFGPLNLGLTRIEVMHRVEGALEATGIIHLRGRAIRELSGGERQRLAIASALAMGPRILVLDEPTASLDVRATREVMATLARLNQEGVTIIIIEHRLGAVAHLARRAVIMEEGRVVADGPTEEVLAQQPLLRRLGLRRPAEESLDDWTALLRPNGRPSGQPIVEFQDVDAGYGRSIVLRGLSLTLYEGEFAALVGDNGAGKSTLARVMAGLIKPRRGLVRLGGGRRLEPGRDVGLLFQNPLDQLFCDSVEEEVSFAPRNLGCYDPAGVDAVLTATDLALLRRRAVHSLSMGQQQRAALAAILAAGPRLIILDEPTMGQDWGHLSAFMDFLARLNRSGCTILLITHDYKLVHRYASRILLLREGRIAADGVPAGYRDQEQKVGAAQNTPAGGKHAQHNP